ncbi:TonB-dependent receptor [Rapidithrix thailandica]|uniref:TonB-dependent receptor n=1 Tax=Rapidithrix thailandica TaxID=413964 RepID=A0AAW9SDC2_9BACT
MLRKLRLVALLCSMCLVHTVYAQDKTINGKVTAAEDGSPLPGVNIMVKGTSVGAISDIKGEYKISVPSEATTLVFSFIGFATQEVEIGSNSTVNVQLTAGLTELTEVVITGYGERSKISYTGSVSSLGGEKIENTPVATVDQVLQGNVAGVQLSASSGTPGAVQDIRIRGVSSITADNDPLIVIDGIPVISGELDRSTSTGSLSVLSSLNPNDIESINVLKDAAATALYGARGANGVIIVTTKKGKSGKATFTASAQVGVVSRAIDGPSLLSASQWDELFYEAAVNAGFAASIEEARANIDNGWDGKTNTDWTDVVSNDDAMQQSYNLSARGGNENTNYYVSMGYFDQDGVVVGVDYERLSGKVDLNSRLTDKLMLKTSTLASVADQNGQLEGSAYYGNPEAAIFFTLPIDPAYNADGSYNLNLSTGTFHPLYSQENNIANKKQTRIFNNTALEFDIVDNLRFISNVGLDVVWNEELYYYNPNYGDGAQQQGESYVYNSRNTNILWKNRLNYAFKLNEVHAFDVSLVHELQKNKYFTTGAGGYGMATDGLVLPDIVATPDFVSGFRSDWGIASILGIVNYAFQNRYFIDLTYRREGNSRFSKDHRYGNFWAVSGSWAFSEESLFKESNWLSLGKLRASYGVNGNAGIVNNSYQQLLSYSGSYYGNPAAEPTQIGNPLLTWESSAYLNLGLDLELFDRVNITAEYFHRRNYDLLLEVPVSRTSGFENQPLNVGEMVNRGFELSVSADIIKTEDFNWNIGFNFTDVENEVKELPVDNTGTEIGITTGTRKVTVGQPVYSWYMQEWAGVDPETGDALWYVSDKNRETTNDYTKAERTFHGSATPTFYGGVNTRIDYKGIWLSANLYYSTGNKVYDSWAGYTMSDGQFTYHVSTGYASQYDRWQEPGDIAPNPKNVFYNDSRSNSTSTRRLYDGTFWRLKDLTLGYNLPNTLVSSIGLTNLSVYLKGTNIWTKVKDDRLEFDPEVKASGLLELMGPPLKSYSIGLSVNF